MSLANAIEETGFSGVCACCGNASRTMSGCAYFAGRYVAGYFVEWTLGRISEHGANYDLIIGDFGDGAKDHDRRSVALAAGAPLSRSEAIGTEIAISSFAIAAAILNQDCRLSELFPA
jgi:hypothetical protein